MLDFGVTTGVIDADAPHAGDISEFALDEQFAIGAAHAGNSRRERFGRLLRLHHGQSSLLSSSILPRRNALCGTVRLGATTMHIHAPGRAHARIIDVAGVSSEWV